MIVTFTTVGYGDISPQSHVGRAVTAIAIFLGLILTAMPLVRPLLRHVWAGETWAWTRAWA